MTFGTLLAALLFAATHIISLLTEPPGQVVVSVVLVLLVGLLLGYYYDCTHNLWGAVIGHNIVDGLSTIIKFI